MTADEGLRAAGHPLRAATDDVWSELDELRTKLRMVISHASGGVLSEPGDIDRSINDICVEITRHKNVVWKHAQEAALRDAALEAATLPQAVASSELVEALELAATALRRAHVTFDRYAKLHYAKGTDEGNEKALANAAERDALDAALEAVFDALASLRDSQTSRGMGNE